MNPNFKEASWRLFIFALLATAALFRVEQERREVLTYRQAPLVRSIEARTVSGLQSWSASVPNP
jgi:hypothetical protein